MTAAVATAVRGLGRLQPARTVFFACDVQGEWAGARQALPASRRLASGVGLALTDGSPPRRAIP